MCGGGLTCHYTPHIVRNIWIYISISREVQNRFKWKILGIDKFYMLHLAKNKLLDRNFKTFKYDY